MQVDTLRTTTTMSIIITIPVLVSFTAGSTPGQYISGTDLSISYLLFRGILMTNTYEDSLLSLICIQENCSLNTLPNS